MKLLDQAETHTLLKAGKILTRMAEDVLPDNRGIAMTIADVARDIAMIVQSALNNDLIEGEG